MFGLVADVLFALIGLLSRCRTGRAGALQAALDDRKQQSSRKKHCARLGGPFNLGGGFLRNKKPNKEEAE